MRTLMLILSMMLLGSLCLPKSFALQGETQAPSATRSFEWTPEMIATMEALPLQHGGRIKPLRTWADFKLLGLSTRRKPEIEQDGEQIKIDAVAWVLDCMFFPELAATYPVLSVDDSSILQAVGLDVGDRGRRDRFSLEDLEPVRTELISSAQRIQGLDGNERSREETQTLDLAIRMRSLEDMMRTLAPIRMSVAVPEGGLLGQWATDGQANLVTLLTDLDQVRSALEKSDQAGQRMAASLAAAMEKGMAAGASGVAMVPPAGTRTDDEEWLDLGQALMATVTEEHETSRSVLLGLKQAQDAASAGDVEELQAALTQVVQATSDRGTARGELKELTSEVAFQNAQLFTLALVLFMCAFLFGALALLPGTRWLTWLAWGTSGIGALILVVGIIWRCLIIGRPPITNLYETAPFIGACGVILAMFVARIQRQKAILPLGALFAVAILFLSQSLELRDAVSSGDSMRNLMAVLDTNFWLATHVTIVTFGYCAALFAWSLAALWVLALPFVQSHRRKMGASTAGWHRSLTRSIYGVVAFGLLFSLVGTILGGIWANYSWGRFWGWDPKENGALVIVLWQLVILHARMGGLIKDLGLALAAVALGSVVVFSWFGVNNLGVGLHSYGFTSGAARAMSFWHMANMLLIGWGLLWWMVPLMRGSQSKTNGA